MCLTQNSLPVYRKKNSIRHNFRALLVIRWLHYFGTAVSIITKLVLARNQFGPKKYIVASVGRNTVRVFI